MSVEAYRATQYTIECDICGRTECCPDSNAENVHSKRDAIRWAGMKRLGDGRIMCEKCFEALEAQHE